MIGNSIVVQWLGLCSFTTIAQVQFLIGELKSHKPLVAAKKWGKKKRKKEKEKINRILSQFNRIRIIFSFREK